MRKMCLTNRRRQKSEYPRKIEYLSRCSFQQSKPYNDKCALQLCVYKDLIGQRKNHLAVSEIGSFDRAVGLSSSLAGFMSEGRANHRHAQRSGNRDRNTHGGNGQHSLSAPSTSFSSRGSHRQSSSSSSSMRTDSSQRQAHYQQPSQAPSTSSDFDESRSFELLWRTLGDGDDVNRRNAAAQQLIKLVVDSQKKQKELTQECMHLLDACLFQQSAYDLHSIFENTRPQWRVLKQSLCKLVSVVAAGSGRVDIAISWLFMHLERWDDQGDPQTKEFKLWLLRILRQVLYSLSVLCHIFTCLFVSLFSHRSFSTHLNTRTTNEPLLTMPPTLSTA